MRVAGRALIERSGRRNSDVGMRWQRTWMRTAHIHIKQVKAIKCVINTHWAQDGDILGDEGQRTYACALDFGSGIQGT